MKIVQITPEFVPCCGGIGRFVFYLSRQLANRGNEIHVIFRGKENRSYNYEQLHIHEIGCCLSSPFNLLSFKKKTETLLYEIKPDLVHTHSTAMPVINYNGPVMVTAHWCNKEGIAVFHRPIRDLDSFCRNLLLPAYTKIESNIINNCDMLTVVSESMKKEFQKHYNVDSQVIYNGVDLDVFGNKNTSKKQNNILFVGKFCVGKGVMDMLNIAEILKNSHPGITIHMIGEGPLKKDVVKKIEQRLLSNVKVLPYVDHSELIDFYDRSKIFILPTHYEGFPTVTLEAMASKLAVIASDVSGLPEQITNGSNGILVKPGDIKGFCDSIIDLIDSPDKIVSLGNKARITVQDQFTWKKITENILGLYQNLL